MDIRFENDGGSWTISSCYPTAGFANNGDQNLVGFDTKVTQADS